MRKWLPARKDGAGFVHRHRPALADRTNSKAKHVAAICEERPGWIKSGGEQLSA
jgi:hypothetical protein